MLAVERRDDFNGRYGGILSVALNQPVRIIVASPDRSAVAIFIFHIYDPFYIFPVHGPRR